MSEKINDASGTQEPPMTEEVNQALDRAGEAMEKLDVSRKNASCMALLALVLASVASCYAGVPYWVWIPLAVLPFAAGWLRHYLLHRSQKIRRSIRELQGEN